MVGKESPLYQIYDHLYKENFGTESIAVMIEGDDVANVKNLNAMLSFLGERIDEILANGGPQVQALMKSITDAMSKSQGQIIGPGWYFDGLCAAPALKACEVASASHTRRLRPGHDLYRLRGAHIAHGGPERGAG